MTPAEFEFAPSGRIVFGAGRAAELAFHARTLGSRALVCTGAHPGRHGALLERLGMPFQTFSVPGEPTVETARAGGEQGRGMGADLVVAIGGVSVIDLGKAVAMLLANGGDPLDYLEIIGAGRLIERPSAPLIAAPTTAGTGSEATANAVLASPGDRCKASLRSAFMVPSVAVVDPLLSSSCPPAVTASSGLDALTQCLEPFVSLRANPVTDALAREGLKRAATGLRRSYCDGNDLEARTDMALCSLLGGIALANAKLGAVHGLAGVIGGTVDIPHGAACAAVLVATVEANVRALRLREPASRALDKYREAAQLLTGRTDAAIEDGTAWIAETVRLLGIGTLSSYGLRPEQAGEVVSKARQASSTKGNPIELRDDELHGVLNASI